MKSLRLITVIVALLFNPAVHADEDNDSYNRISLEASASAEVENDTMIVTLYALEEGSQASELSSRVNKTINQALESIRQYESIKVETESYSTTPVYNKSQVVGWRVRQSIRLESKDIALLSEVLGNLQQQLKLNRITFSISPDRQEQQLNQLIDQALASYNKRATRIANRLQASGYKIVKLDVSTSGGVIAQRYATSRVMMAESDSMVAPDIAKGDQTLTVRVSGIIELE